MMKIAVFGVAGNDLEQAVYDEARLFGRLLGERGHELVFPATPNTAIFIIAHLICPL